VIAAPNIPTHRPPTRKEVWARGHALYYDRKTHQRRPECDDRCLTQSTPGELEAWCRSSWVGCYAYAVAVKGWAKQPDWVDGDPVLPEATTNGEEIGRARDSGGWTKLVYALLEKASATHNQRRAA
jgi:hypothetical protein